MEVRLRDLERVQVLAGHGSSRISASAGLMCLVRETNVVAVERLGRVLGRMLACVVHRGELLLRGLERLSLRERVAHATVERGEVLEVALETLEHHVAPAGDRAMAGHHR